MATKEEIEDIVKTTLETRRIQRISKIFRDPIKAENVAFVLGMALFMSVAINILQGTAISYDIDQLKKSGTNTYYLYYTTLDHMSCHELKITLHDIQKNTAKPGMEHVPTGDIQNMITSKC